MKLLNNQFVFCKTTVDQVHDRARVFNTKPYYTFIYDDSDYEVETAIMQINELYACGSLLDKNKTVMSIISEYGANYSYFYNNYEVNMII